jgi:glycosyltransferase involved in cell wall biosynthesis
MHVGDRYSPRGPMRFSVVVPTRNQARFIRRCIDSCLAQDVPDAEIVVVDGLSSDGTQRVLDSYGDRIRWISERDDGQPDAINKGIRMTSGEIVTWINSDDYYASPDAVPRVLEAFASRDDVDLVYGDGVLVDTDYREIRPLRARRALTARSILLLAGMAVSQPSVFFRRDLFEAVGGVDERLHLTMDYDLWIRMFTRAREVVYLPEVLSCTTSHADAKTVRAMLPQIREIGKVKRRHAPRFDLTTVERFRLHAMWLSMYVYWAAVKIGLKRAA